MNLNEILQKCLQFAFKRQAVNEASQARQAFKRDVRVAQKTFGKN